MVFFTSLKKEHATVSTDRKIAWISLLVGVIALIPLFHEPDWKWPALLAVVVVAAGGYLVFNEWKFSRTAMTTIEVKKRVKIHDNAGVASTLTRTQKVRINYAWVGEIWFRNMVTDGSFGPVTIDGAPPSGTTTMGCLTSYYKTFNPPLSKGTIKEVRFECTVANSFPASEEGLLHEVVQGTQMLILEVELPPNRPCLSAQLLLEAGGEPARKLEDPKISDDRRTITSEIKVPHTGYTYHLHWTW
jgi:hypothetical protein